MKKEKSEFTKQWIIDNAINIVDDYEKGVLTLRGLHYQLVGLGMTNDIAHYKKVVNSMISARWDDLISFDTFSDLDRAMVGETASEEIILENEIESSKNTISYWMDNYYKNRWENQPYYPEVFIEKKALQGVFQRECRNWNVALGACKGYPSLTFLHESYLRFKDADERGKKVIILYFGDYDPSGEDIPRSIYENILRFGLDIEIRRIALMENQVIEWNLPPAPAKETDSRTANWGGLGQVELDAVKPEMLMKLLTDSLKSIFDEALHDELMEVEASEKIEYKRELRQFIIDLQEE
jgi:hypothetical protein